MIKISFSIIKQMTKIIILGAILLLILSYSINKETVLIMQWWEIVLAAIGLLCGYWIFWFIIILCYVVAKDSEK